MSIRNFVVLYYFFYFFFTKRTLICLFEIAIELSEKEQAQSGREQVEKIAESLKQQAHFSRRTKERAEPGVGVMPIESSQGIVRVDGARQENVQAEIVEGRDHERHLGHERQARVEHDKRDHASLRLVVFFFRFFRLRHAVVCRHFQTRLDAFSFAHVRKQTSH